MTFQASPNDNPIIAKASDLFAKVVDHYSNSEEFGELAGEGLETLLNSFHDLLDRHFTILKKVNTVLSTATNCDSGDTSCCD